MRHEGRSLGLNPLLAAFLSLGAAAYGRASGRSRRTPAEVKQTVYIPNARYARVKALRPPMHRGMYRKLQKRSVW